VTDFRRNSDEFFPPRFRIFRIPGLQNGQLVVGDHRPDPGGTGFSVFWSKFVAFGVAVAIAVAVVIVVFRVGEAVLDRSKSKLKLILN
jgi:hypothetical protein